jgi:hypothetical protein
MPSNQQQKPMTKRDLATFGMEALDKTRAGQVAVTRAAGGVSFASALEVMEFAKLMAVADKAVPRHLRNNAGACLRIVFQAVEWQMSPWAVADKSYEVNDRIAYESQLIHAVIEARAPLRERLICEYAGEGAERECRVVGKFLDGTERDYTTPQIGKIRVKNSPLWKDDPDQQLFYAGSRSWARKWCPDVLMGLYTKDELARDPTLGRDESELPGPGLHARLVSGNVDREEGHREGYVETELGPEKDNASVDDAEPRGDDTTAPATSTVRKGKRSRKTKPVEAIAPSPSLKAEDIKNAKQWAIYCAAWLRESISADDIRKRWDAERKLRNNAGVTADERVPVQNYMVDRCKELGEPQ